MIIVKIGGGFDINLKGIIEDIIHLRDSNDEQFIILHGANAFRDDLARNLNFSKQILTSVSGYSSVYSDEKAIDLIMMSYSGLRSKRIVELCQIYGLNAIGLSGIDGKLIQGRRNKGIRVRENNKIKIKRDLSGKPVDINLKLLNLLLDNGYIPVLTIPILDEKNVAINSENDDIVVILNNKLRPDKVIQLIEAPGLLSDFNKKNSLIKTLSKKKLKEMEGSSQGRIKRKLFALVRLVENNSCIIYISDGRVEHPIKMALKGEGTIII